MNPIMDPESSSWSALLREDFPFPWPRPRPRPIGISQAALNLNNQMRELWEQHGAWTRMAIMSIVFNLPDEQATLRRLLRNPSDFADALLPFYGKRNAREFDRLLTDHLAIAADLVRAAQAGNARRVEQLDRRWHQNAREIAAFFARINPFWSERRWRDMLFEHLRQVTQEAVTMLQGQFERSVRTYDAIETQSLGMADEMWRGIVRQFPRRF